MPNLPRATTTVSDTASALASGIDNVCLIAPVPQNADLMPRLFGDPAAIFALHGYSEGLEYAALHAERVRKPILFIGVPIETPGTVGRHNTSGNTGASVVTVAAGSDGSLTDHEGKLTVIRGGTIGADQILLGLSLDGGKSTKRVRLGTANSYTIPYVGVTISFGAGDLVAGDVAHTWTGRGPRSATASWATARANLAAQMKGFRSILLVEEMSSVTEATALLNQVNAYETANERFVYGRCHVYDRLPLAALSNQTHRMTGNPNLTFAEVGATGDTITRSAGSFISDGFAAGDIVTISGSASNDMTTAAKVVTVTATVITLDTDDLAAEGPVGNVSIVGERSLTFANSGETITRSGGSWLDDGFRVGDTVDIVGTDSATNDGSFVIATLTPTAMTLAAGGVTADEVIGVTAVSVTSGQTKAEWMAEIDAEFAGLDDEYRIDIAAGKGRVQSPFTGWFIRRPASWAASLREYQHDLHIATWRKKDGPTGFDLNDGDGNLVEWDDRVDGAAGSQARFTTFRTWANGPNGAFIALSLTRALESSPLVMTHNVAVVNLAQTIAQLNSELVVGETLILKEDGTATADSLATQAQAVNDALSQQLLVDARGEGPRASRAVWTPADDDDLSVPEATLTAVLDLNLNGTVHSVITKIRVRSGGQ